MSTGRERKRYKIFATTQGIVQPAVGVIAAPLMILICDATIIPTIS